MYRVPVFVTFITVCSEVVDGSLFKKKKRQIQCTIKLRNERPLCEDSGWNSKSESLCQITEHYVMEEPSSYVHKTLRGQKMEDPA